ncbi:hypothetical protein Fmac_027377 [Flemingia macrophylla]|uniref:Uncharacterized protein n=1 Tax=Flemingia macrophylla TaxID=520843 RepID=A0ABD1LI34_9FABA
MQKLPVLPPRDHRRYKLLQECPVTLDQQVLLTSINRADTHKAKQNALTALNWHFYQQNQKLETLQQKVSHYKTLVSLHKPFTRNNASHKSKQNLLHARDGTLRVQASIVVALRNLIVFSESKDKLREKTQVAVLLGLASFMITTVRRMLMVSCSIWTLRRMRDSSVPLPSLEVAMEMLRHLSSNRATKEILVTKGFVKRVMGYLVVRCWMGGGEGFGNATVDVAYALRESKIVSEG